MLMLKANVNTFPLDGMHLALHYYTNREEFTQNERQDVSVDFEGTSVCVYAWPDISSLTNPLSRPTLLPMKETPMCPNLQIINKNSVHKANQRHYCAVIHSKSWNPASSHACWYLLLVLGIWCAILIYSITQKGLLKFQITRTWENFCWGSEWTFDLIFFMTWHGKWVC